jgi:hypothetical protein
MIPVVLRQFPALYKRAIQGHISTWPKQLPVSDCRSNSMSERTASIAFFDCDAIAALVFGQITPDDQGIAFALVDVHRNATRSLPSSLPMTLPKNSNATLETHGGAFRRKRTKKGSMANRQKRPASRSMTIKLICQCTLTFLSLQANYGRRAVSIRVSPRARAREKLVVGSIKTSRWSK